MSDLLAHLSPPDREKARERPMPDGLDPMLARLTEDHFSGEGWIFERKLDGERMLAWVEPRGSVRLRSRNGKRLNDSYPELEEAVRDQAPRGCILDGEVVAFDENRRTDFQRLQSRMQATSREEARASGIQVHYYLFDCLYAAGHDLRSCSVRSRKKVLRAAVTWSDPLRWMQHRNNRGLDYYREACRRGWEGLVAKDAGSSYVQGRSGKWLKLKCLLRQEFVIGGFTEPEGRRVGFGALLLGFYREDDLVYAGQVGTGFDDETLEELGGLLEVRERAGSPYDAGDPPKRGVHFVSPELVCEVAFTQWTRDGRLRHPRYRGLRRDKEAREVRREAKGPGAGL